MSVTTGSTSPGIKPVTWLLDVDGVLNAVARKPDLSVWPASAWVRLQAQAGGRTYPILAARPVLDFVTEVAASDTVEVRWHTTWRHDAVASLAPALGLPELVVEHAPEFDSRAGSASGYAGTYSGPAWWKLPAARRVIAGGGALVWTDDDLARVSVRREVDEEPVPVERALLIAPRTELGLTPAHLREIAAFVERWQ